MTDVTPQKERGWQVGVGKVGWGVSLGKNLPPLLLCTEDMGAGHLVTDTSTPAIALVWCLSAAHFQIPMPTVLLTFRS